MQQEQGHWEEQNVLVRELFWESEAFWWSRIPNDTRGRSQIFCPTPTPEVQLDHFYITLLSWEFLLNRYNFLWNFCWNRGILAMYHDFHWVLVQGAESEILERLESDILPPTPQPWMPTWLMASIGLVMVMQSNFCNRDFLTDHKFSMGLRSGEFPGQPITFNFASWKSSSLFQMIDPGQCPGIFLHHLEMPFSYLEWLFSQ